MLSRRRGEHDFEEAVWLRAAFRSGAHHRLGYGSFIEYLDRLFGYTPRQASERLRVSEALEELPMLGEALRDGQLSWSAVRELSRVVSPESEGEWIEAARDKTSREVEDLFAGRRPGDRPGDAPREETRRHVLRFEVSPEVMATFREAVGMLRREASGGLDEEEALLAMAREVLGGPKEEGRASYQIALTRCEGCNRSWQHGRGEPIAVQPEVTEMAECDHHDIGPTHVGKPARATQSIPPAIRRQVLRRDQGRCVVPGCRSSVYLDVHHLHPRADGGTHDPDGLAVLCGAHHRAVHRGFLMIEGSVSTGLVFSHADGTPYGGAPSPGLSEAFGVAFKALAFAGFKETESRRMLDGARTNGRARTHVGD